MTPRLNITLAIVMAAAGVVPAAQGVFSSRTFIVRVDVLATDKGKPVLGLTADDFEVFDNGRRQAIDIVDTHEMPVNAALALDSSGSTAGSKLGDLRSAGEALVDDLRPNEPVSVTTFSHLVTPQLPLTLDHRAAREVLRAVDSEGETAAIDGTYVAMMSAQSAEGRPLVMVFTDGLDTASWLQPDELIEATRRANSVVYTVASGSARRWPFLSEIANATGGRAITIDSSKDLRREFQEILAEFRSRYLLAFTPKGVSETGYHSLSVKVKRGGVQVRARPGYTAGR